MKTPKLLNYQDIGHGSVVVLLHGYMASSRYWAQVSDTLAQSHRVISIDLLGFGKSPKPGCSRYDYDAHMASINATLDSIGIDEPFTLVGHSMGALVSLRYASIHPLKVSKLLLTNMPIFLDAKLAREEIMGTNIFYKIGLRPGLNTIVMGLFKLITVLRLLPNKVGDGAASRRTYIFQSTAASRLRSLRNVIYSAKIEADLAAVTATTVILSGLDDRIGYIRDLGKLNTLSGNITTTSVAGGHHLPLLRPDLVASFI
ncbi:MAG: alpha/beta hydrolase [Candidatus Saccharimonadales bacterium]